MAWLPRFSTLLAFDAAARHGTLTRAAAELNVSQPAISRRISDLEQSLGLALFDRSTKPMRLTPEGMELFDVLRGGLSRLETTIQDLRMRSKSRKFTIAAAPGFLSYWLLPRLPALREAFPDLDLGIITGDYGNMPVQADVHIRFGTGSWEGLQALKVVGEEVFPVCAPVYLAKHPGGLPPEKIAQARLLQLEDSAERWYDWPAWLRAAQVPLPPRLDAISFDSYATVINAALAGQGVALSWAGLLEPYLETGALIRVSDHSLVSERGYFITYRDQGGIAPDLAQWLLNSGWV